MLGSMGIPNRFYKAKDKTPKRRKFGERLKGTPLLINFPPNCVSQIEVSYKGHLVIGPNNLKINLK